jgi:acetyl esterase
MHRKALVWLARYYGARAAAHLPDRVKVLLSGEPPVVIDGQRLDPQIQLLRAFNRRMSSRGLLEPTIAAGRARYRRETHALRGPVTAVGSVRDLDIEAASGPLRARHYTPPDVDEAAPITVYLHGGGFVIGDLDTHDEPCRILCRHGRVHVLSVAYRLAPEHPCPAALDDARAAFAWARANARTLGTDPLRVAMGGDSAGANLATVTSRLAGASAPAAQLLIYPATDAATQRPSQSLFGQGFFLSKRDCDAFYDHYASAAGIRRDDPLVSPLFDAGVSRAPPALLAIAGFDVLRDEGEAYADALARAGTLTRVVRFPGLVHGFIHMTGICPAADTAMRVIAGAWRSLLDDCSAGSQALTSAGAAHEA